MDLFALAFLLWFGVTLGVDDLYVVLHVHNFYKVGRYFGYNSIVFIMNIITVLNRDLITPDTI